MVFFYYFYFFKMKGIIFLVLLHVSVFAQNNYLINLSKIDYICTSGSAGIQIDTLKTTDTLFINWSNGQSNVFSITDLAVGNYNVNLIIKGKVDTTINFTIDKVACPINPSNHFTPNGDNYNDTWQITNINTLNKFDVLVFNKWGQKVHEQKDKYIPWDGNWNGIKAVDATYYYIITYEDGKDKKTIKGDVTILR